MGRTQGRGRQDRFRQRAESVKDIYVYPLQKDFRRRLGLAESCGTRALDPAEGMDAAGWAEQEFGHAPLGDKRLSRRLVEVARQKAEKPGHAFTGVVEGDWPKVKAYYRMIDQPEDSLDIKSIWTDVCVKLRDGKERRQFIFTTHNSSLAVASDSDNFLIMEADANKGRVDLTGSMDHEPLGNEVLDYLEGGIETYRRKFVKYDVYRRLNK